MAGPRLGKAWWSDPVPTQVGVGGWGSCPYTTKQEEAQPGGRERMEALDEGWVHSLRSWASLNFMSPSVYWCPQPSGASRVSYTVSPGGALSGVRMPVTDHCTESGVRKYFRLGSVRETRAWCDHKVWFAYSPPCTLKAPEREACTLKTPEREASTGSHTGQAVGCVSHLFIHLSVFLTTRSLSVSCHWHMDVWSARIHPLFNIQLLEKLPGVLTQRIQPAQM